MDENAMQYALRKLARRSYSRKAMGQMLSDQGYDLVAVREVLTRLEHLGYIDDLGLARDMVRRYTERQPKGRSWIQAKLKQNGLDGPVINQALEAYPADVEKTLALAAANSYLKSRAGRFQDEQKKTAALARFLEAKGFSVSLIHTTLQSIQGINPPE